MTAAARRDRPGIAPRMLLAVACALALAVTGSSASATPFSARPAAEILEPATASADGEASPEHVRPIVEPPRPAAAIEPGIERKELRLGDWALTGAIVLLISIGFFVGRRRMMGD